MNEEIKEIQELKEELAALHRKIDEQAEIKDSMIKKAVASSISKLQKIGNSSFLICIIALILLEAIVFLYGLSIGIKTATLILFGINACIAYIIMRKNDAMDVSEDLVRTTEKALEYKKWNRNSTLILLPFALAWVVWFVYEVSKKIGVLEGEFFYVLILCALVGMIIGGLIGYFTMYKPSMEEADKIINELKDIRES